MDRIYFIISFKCSVLGARIPYPYSNLSTSHLLPSPHQPSYYPRGRVGNSPITWTELSKSFEGFFSKWVICWTPFTFLFSFHITMTSCIIIPNDPAVVYATSNQPTPQPTQWLWLGGLGQQLSSRYSTDIIEIYWIYEVCWLIFAYCGPRENGGRGLQWTMVVLPYFIKIFFHLFTFLF